MHNLTEFKKHMNGAEPYPWQLDVAESILLGLDSIVIAGISKNRPTIVVSPLKQLQREHSRRFRKAGVAATPMNGENWTETLVQTISEG
ncbi:hypothetical protein ABKN59_009093 [Abortiporus biennis]